MATFLPTFLSTSNRNSSVRSHFKRSHIVTNSFDLARVIRKDSRHAWNESNVPLTPQNVGLLDNTHET